MDNFRYATWELDTMVEAVERPNPFLLKMFFPTVKLSEAAEIEFDIVEGGRRLAPFVSPLVQGRPVRGRGYSTKNLKPAYIKPSGLVTPSQGFTRRPGEPYGGTMTPKQRVDRLLADKIALHDEMIDNRLEWMASQALVNGSITVAGEDYPSVTVEFGQNPNLRRTLEPGVKWSESGGVPLDDIEEMAIRIRKYSYGAVADTIVMDGSAWKFFRKKMEGNVNFQTTTRLGSSTLEIGPRNNIDGELVGRVAGRFDVYVYDGHYEDENGEMQPYLPPYTVLVGSRAAIEGAQYFGAIMDLEAGLVPMRHFVKSWVSKDPSGVTVLSQSAPLVAPKRPNAIGRLTVHS